MKAESAVVDTILAWLEAQGGGGYKVYGNQLQRGGEPDIDGQYYSERLGRWVHLKIEVKYGDGVTSVRQDFRLDVYRLRGYCACAVWGVAGVINAIAAYEEQHAQTTANALTDKLSRAMGHLAAVVRAWREPNEVKSRRETAKAVGRAEDFLLEETGKRD